jgi:hypothetical protein
MSQQALSAFWPLDETKGILSEVISSPYVFELFGIKETIEIEVIHAALADLVRLHQSIARASNWTPDAEGAQPPAHQRCLTTAKSAFKANNAGFDPSPRQPRPQGFHFTCIGDVHLRQNGIN